jgi:hypothetical protein
VESPLLAEGRSAASIAADLRREFDAAFLEAYGTRPDRDPMLAVLFQALAAQVARVYVEAEHVFPERVVDDLVASLGLQYASAVPSQTTVAFRDISVREPITAELPLVGYSRTGEEVRFAVDVPITLVPAVLRFAAVMEGGRLQSVSGAFLDSDGTPFPPAAAECAPTKAAIVFLAVDCPDRNLGQLGIHLEANPRGGHVERALARSPWHLLSREGVISEEGTMAARSAKAGVRALHLVKDNEARPTPSRVEVAFDVGEGPWGQQCFVLPELPQCYREPGAVPRVLREHLPRMLPEEYREAYSNQPLQWIAIALPAGVSKVATSLQSVTLNAITASNLEILSEHVVFERDGSVVAVRPEGVIDRFLVGAQSVLGETNEPYVEESSVDAPARAGRYRLDRNRVWLEPARSETGRFDRFADLRLVFTDGDRGNGVDVGRVSRVVGLSNPTTQVTNLTPSRGGTNPPEYPLSRLRLAESLRSRDRAITADDFQLLAQAFEPRVRRATVQYRASISDRRLQPVHCVQATVSRRDFGDPEAELVRLRSSLETHLQQRALVGQVIRVEIEELP